MGLKIASAALAVLLIAPVAARAQAPAPTPEATSASLGQGYAYSDSTLGGAIYFAAYTVGDVAGFSIRDVYYAALFAGDREVSAAPLNVYNDGGTEARNRGFTKGLAIVALPETSADALRDGVAQTLTLRLRPLPAAKALNAALADTAPTNIRTLTSKASARQEFLTLLQQIGADWSLDLLDAGALSTAGRAYVNGFSSELIDALDLGTTLTGALPRRGDAPAVGDGPGGITPSRIAGAWSVDEGLEQIAEASGVPLTFLSSGIMILLSIVIYVGARASLGPEAGAIALVLTLAVGMPLGVAAGFFPAASVMIIVALMGVGAIGYAVVRGMPS